MLLWDLTDSPGNDPQTLAQDEEGATSPSLQFLAPGSLSVFFCAIVVCLLLLLWGTLVPKLLCLCLSSLTSHSVSSLSSHLLASALNGVEMGVPHLPGVPHSQESPTSMFLL